MLWVQAPQPQPEALRTLELRWGEPAQSSPVWITRNADGLTLPDGRIVTDTTAPQAETTPEGVFVYIPSMRFWRSLGDASSGKARYWTLVPALLKSQLLSRQGWLAFVERSHALPEAQMQTVASDPRARKALQEAATLLQTALTTPQSPTQLRGLIQRFFQTLADAGPANGVAQQQEQSPQSVKVSGSSERTALQLYTQALPYRLTLAGMAQYLRYRLRLVDELRLHQRKTGGPFTPSPQKESRGQQAMHILNSPVAQPFWSESDWEKKIGFGMALLLERIEPRWSRGILTAEPRTLEEQIRSSLNR